MLQSGLHAGWSKTFNLINSPFDETECGPKNMPDSIGMDSKALDFLSLFFDHAFWTNLVTKRSGDQIQIYNLTL